MGTAAVRSCLHINILCHILFASSHCRDAESAASICDKKHQNNWFCYIKVDNMGVLLGSCVVAIVCTLVHYELHNITRWSPFLPSCAQMIVWSRSTASGGPTSPSSPTPPVGQPERRAPQVPPSPPHPARLHSQKSPSIICRRRWWNLPFNNLQVAFSKEEIWRKTNNCGCSVSPL